MYGLDQITFKIDSIVWKYEPAEPVSAEPVPFKIDSIVWKLNFMMTQQVHLVTFKIDSIVWKWGKLNIFKRSEASL